MKSLWTVSKNNTPNITTTNKSNKKHEHISSNIHYVIFDHDDRPIRPAPSKKRQFSGAGHSDSQAPLTPSWCL